MKQTEINITESSKSPLLEVKGVSFSYTPDSPVFTDVCFELNPGDIFTLLGPNGSGKSTLLHCLGGLLSADSGTIKLNGIPIGDMSSRQIALILGYVPQIQNIAFRFQVMEYLVLGRAPYLPFLKTPGPEEYAIVESVMEELKITHLADKNMQQISGGERQQVQIARVLVQDPKVILMDEPTNHLDYGNQLKILELILRLAKRRNVAVLLTTHTPDQTILLGGRVGLMDRSGHLNVGSTDKIVTAENLKGIYHSNLHMVYINEIERMACVPGKLHPQSEP